MRRPDRALLFRIAIYVLVLPWIAVASTRTSQGLPIYLGEVAGLVGIVFVLLRVSPSFLRSRWARVAEVVLWNGVLIFLLFEGGMRLYLASGAAPGWLQSSPDTVRYRLNPGNAWLGKQPNTLGFYDEEFAESKPPGIVRVVVLGDSYTVGLVPYTENYVTRIDDALGDRVEVLNLGVVHMAVRQYLEILVSDGLRFDPDLVVVSLFIGNDIRRDPPRGLFSEVGSEALSAARVLWTVFAEGSPYRSALSVNSHGLFRLEADGTRVEEPVMSVEKHLRREWKHLDALFGPPGTDRMRESWSDTEAALGELVEVCRARGTPVVATLAPDEIQVTPKLLNTVAAHYSADPARFDMDYPNRRLGALLERLSVPVLDFTPALREAEREAPTYHPRAVHWNRRGNDVVARTLVPWLRDQIETLVSDAAAVLPRVSRTGAP
jgi:lysophospholipase L1-like esterase